MYQGDTIRLKVHFKSFSGQSIDPSDIKLTIYKSDKTKIEQFILDDTCKENVGVYFYDFVPIGLSEFVYEFSGLYNNKPILARDKVQIKFI